MVAAETTGATVEATDASVDTITKRKKKKAKRARSTTEVEVGVGVEKDIEVPVTAGSAWEEVSASLSSFLCTFDALCRC